MADTGADDFYADWYQSKLWQLLPAVYRNQDTVTPGVPGALQELLNRIGAQTATLRRSIDRLWENQSIETCDDWVIPYIGDLLATRLVSCLDARAQRIDVAKTIYYRRRAGTLGLLEELVADIAGRDARAEEFFRRLGRTRHQFDPPIGNAFAADADPWANGVTYSPGEIVANGNNAYICIAGGISATTGNGPVGTGASITDGSATWGFESPLGAVVPAVIQGLAGVNSRTPAGGFADLRNPLAAASTNTAFDEFAHIADLRAGGQSFGWQNIPHLGLFIWWLTSYPINGATPVGNATGCFTFDPSGRKIPLFSPQSRLAASFGDDWVSPNEWNLPGPVRDVLWNAYPDQLYPGAFAVEDNSGGTPAPMPYDGFSIHPETGLFSFLGGTPAGLDIVTKYCYGLMSTAGAGGNPLSLLTAAVVPASGQNVQGGGAGLTLALGAITADNSFIFQDTLTYAGPTATLDIGANTVAFTVIGRQRPLIRWTTAGSSWTIQGEGGSLILQGIWFAGANLVLTGSFESVILQFVTLDPGTAKGAAYATAIDGVALTPTLLSVQASITTLTLDHCITGPIQTSNGGAIKQLNANDSIIQALPDGGTPVHALQTQIGAIALTRCTVLGSCAVHEMSASETIFDRAAVAENTQAGCIRFCAIAKGSALHAPYRSVKINPHGPLFRSRAFGDPNYARLTRLADAAIINPGLGDTILGGAENGSEMGAFQSQGVTLQKRGLVLKFEEYAPLGVYPVWIEAD
jgi:hypothetical protein